VKTVLVTGGGGAIGAAICRRFCADRVLVADRNAEAARRVANEVGGEALVFDISNYEQAKAALADRAVDVLMPM